MNISANGIIGVFELALTFMQSVKFGGISLLWMVQFGLWVSVVWMAIDFLIDAFKGGE
jgi:hypothetical protein